MRERLAHLRLLKYGGRGPVAGLVAMLLVQNLLPAATAVATAALLNARGRDHLVPLLVLGGVLLAGQSCTSFVQPLRNLAAARIDGAHRAALATRAVSVPTVDALEREDVQDLVRAAAADPVEWVEKTPANAAFAQLSLVVRWVGMVASAAVVAAWSWWLVPSLVLPALATREVARRQWLRHYRIWLAGMAHKRRHQYWGEVASGHAEAKELRVFGFGEWVVARQQHHMRAHLDPVWRDDWRKARAQWQQLTTTAVPLAAVFCWVGWATAHGHGSVAVATAVLTASWSVFQSISRTYDAIDLEGARPVLAAARALEERLPEAAPRPAGGALPDAPPLVRFEGVGFRYPGAARPVLDGLDLEIRPGELLAVVGLNGAGKSTLTRLLAMLYEPTAGRITAGGTDLADIGPREWRRRLAIVFQDFVRYHLSLAENIALGRPGPCDRAAVEAAARDAGLAEVAGRLPLGWDTPLSRTRTDGVDLSGGQWQQVALARALYAVRDGARVLVLDEPTAHLDVRSELELFQRLGGLTEGVSKVLISHRLSTVRQADRIVLLDGGRITESGTHEELMALGGQYAAMYTIQAERFTRGFDDRLDDGDLEEEPTR